MAIASKLVVSNCDDGNNSGSDDDDDLADLDSTALFLRFIFSSCCTLPMIVRLSIERLYFFLFLNNHLIFLQILLHLPPQKRPAMAAAAKQSGPSDGVHGIRFRIRRGGEWDHSTVR
jgi:hypothetical protein